MAFLPCKMTSLLCDARDYHTAGKKKFAQPDIRGCSNILTHLWH